jgi:hypothetical protein
VSCLVENKEWHEGYVTQFHKSGKHFVEFRQIGEKRWLNMKKLAFYIVERPPYSQNSASAEFKEDETFENVGLAPIEVRVELFHIEFLLFSEKKMCLCY